MVFPERRLLRDEDPELQLTDTLQAYAKPPDRPEVKALNQPAKDPDICSSRGLLLTGGRLGRFPHLGEFIGNEGPDQTDTVLDRIKPVG